MTFSDSDIATLEEAARLLFGKRKALAAAIAELDGAPVDGNGSMNGSTSPAELGRNPHVRRVVEALKQRDRGKSGRYLESLR
jgi:hypothetical protein